MCKNGRVYVRSIAVVALCLSLAAVRVLGLHSHVSHGDRVDTDSVLSAVFGTAHVHEDHVVLSAADTEAVHIAAHFDHGDVDVDSPAMGVAKASLLQAPLILVGILCALVVPHPKRVAPVLQPPLRPPRIRLRRFLLPPTQAPPRTV